MTAHSPAAPDSSIADPAALRRAARSVVLFRGVLDDAVGRAFLALLDALAAGEWEGPDAPTAYGTLFALLAEQHELDPAALPGNAWQAHLARRLVQDENPYSRKAQAAPVAAMGPALLEQARRDLRALGLLYRAAARALAERARAADAAPPPAWDGLCPLGATPDVPAIVRAFPATEDWGTLAEALAAQYAAAGTGLFGRFVAFRWTRAGELDGIAHPDPIRLDDLIGYETERQQVVANTARFVAGLPANNVLLYGDRGTGKSSTVKALLNAYAGRGLRLVEVPKEALGEFGRLVRLLRGRRERFLVFVDDLSFEEHETEYKGLKAILEGSLEARPDNVLLYATSNRRHLVRQRFADRDSDPDDIHIGDTVEEKLSLSDRFGLRVRFLAPDQGRYLQIARGLAARRALEIADDELERRALRWATRHGGRSARTARQFVDHLTGELAEA